MVLSIMKEGQGINLGQQADQLGIFCTLWTKVSFNAIVQSRGLQTFQKEFGQGFMHCFEGMEGPCQGASYCLDAWVSNVERLLACSGKRQEG